MSAISGDTGKVIDVRILSKYCRCQNRLQQEHVNGCVANYQGGSGKKEVEGVLKMFQESEALHGVRYKFYLGDGDSSSFATVEKEHPYGPDIQVVKKECVGHVQKRMGTRLRSLKKKMGKNPLSNGRTIGVKGRLTNVVINEMQVFYGLAIRRNFEVLKPWKLLFRLNSSI